MTFNRQDYFINLTRNKLIWISFCSFISLLLFCCDEIGESADNDIAPGPKNSQHQEIMLVDFERGIPCSHDGDIVGFRKQDKAKCDIVQGGAEGSKKSAVFRIGPTYRDIYFQGDVRRKYLATKNTKYIEKGPNALCFWVKLHPDSILIDRIEEIKVGGKVIARKKSNRNTLGVWTYHWRYGDMGVGGKSNTGLATDSMMHAYSNFRFGENAAGKWVRVILSPSAFQQCRYYYHFYAARGTTDDLKFFPSVRQVQFRIFPRLEKEEDFQIDQIKLIYCEPTIVFEKEFFEGEISKDVGDLSLPVVLRNPTDKNRKYRVFISSFLGAEREVLNKAVSLTDSLKPARKMQHTVGGDGGVGAVELQSEDGKSVMKKDASIPLGGIIAIPAGGTWRGKLVHHIKPRMLGKQKVIRHGEYEFYARRDTLTTSVIVWDPEDSSIGEMDYIKVKPDNSDDGNHPAPPGFPKQFRPPKGWRSEDIPLNQVGAYFVSVLHLEE